MPPAVIAAALAGGALVGGASGFFGGKAQRDNTNAAIHRLEGQDYAGQTRQLNDTLQGGYSPYLDEGGQDYQAYKDKVAGFDPSQFAYEDPAAFGYDLNAKTKEFLDPSMDYQIGEATRAVEGSAANRGSLFSGASGKAIADRSQSIAQQSWKDALATAMADRGFEFGKYGQDVQWDRQAKDQGLNLWNTQTTNMGNIANTGMQANIGLATGQAGNLGNQFAAENNRDLAISNLMAGKGAGAWGGAAQGALTGAGMAGQVIGGYYGGMAGAK